MNRDVFSDIYGFLFKEAELNKEVQPYKPVKLTNKQTSQLLNHKRISKSDIQRTDREQSILGKAKSLLDEHVLGQIKYVEPDDLPREKGEQ